MLYIAVHAQFVKHVQEVLNTMMRGNGQPRGGGGRGGGGRGRGREGRGGQGRTTSNFSNAEHDSLLDAVDVIKPLGREEWEAALAQLSK